MLQKNCNHDCDHNQCPFVQDASHPNRYVCLKCGIDRTIDHNYLTFPPLWLLILAAIILVLLTNQPEKSETPSELQKQNQLFRESIR